MTAAFVALEKRTGEVAHTANQSINGIVALGSQRMIAIAGALVLLTGGSLFLFGRSITVPLALLTRAAKKLAIGDVEVENDLPHPSRDEMGTLAASFRAMVGHQHAVAEAAEGVAAGDLRRGRISRGEQDRLGRAIDSMVADLRELISNVRRRHAPSGVDHRDDGCSRYPRRRHHGLVFAGCDPDFGGSRRVARDAKRNNRAARSGVAELLAVRAREMQDASANVGQNMASASSAVEENAAAAEMRNTAEHLTNIMLPVAETAEKNADAATEAAVSTRRLAGGIADIDATARGLRDQAKELQRLLSRFKVEDAASPGAPGRTPEAV